MPCAHAMVRSLAVCAAVHVLSVACQPSSGLAATVTASIVGSSLRIENGTSSPVYYFAVERTTAAAINWAPCIEGPDCRAIPPEGVVTIPLANVYGFAATSKDALVYWWVRVPAPTLSSHRPGRIAATVARR